MARRKKRSTRRRYGRRVSGIGRVNFNAVLMQVAGTAGGALLANFLNKSIGANLDPKLVAAGEILIGALVIPQAIKGDIGQGVGSGMLAVGTIKLLQGFGVITGIDQPGGSVFWSDKQLEAVSGNEMALVSGGSLNGVGQTASRANGELALISGLELLD